MKIRAPLALGMALAVSLSGCGGAIVESAVTESQVIDVNEPSAVEQAIEQEDIPFVNETESIIAFEKEYAAKNPTSEKEYSEMEQEVCNAAQEKFRYWTVPVDDVAAAWAANEALQYDLEQPDETCITPQQAANAAGRATKKIQPDTDLVVYMVTMRLSEQPATSRLAYQMEVVTKPEEGVRPQDQESVCAFCIDAVTGELIQIYKFDGAFTQNEDTDLEGFAQKGQAELQGYLDALGAGQTCTAFENMDKVDEKTAMFTTNINGKAWDVNMKNGLILYAQPAPEEE